MRAWWYLKIYITNHENEYGSFIAYVPEQIWLRGVTTLYYAQGMVKTETNQVILTINLITVYYIQWND